MKVCLQFSEKMLPCSVGGHPGEEWPRVPQGFGRKPLEELLNTVAEEKQLEDSVCDRVNRT